MLKFCTNKRIRASLLRQVCFFGGERGHFAPKKGVTLHPRATDFREKKAVFFGRGGKGAFRPKKGCNAPSAGYRFPRKKNLDDLLNSLTAIGFRESQLIYELRSTVVSCQIFILSQSLVAHWTRNDFSLPAVSCDFYEAFLIDDVSRGSKLYLFCARSNLNPFRRLTVFSSPILGSG